MRIENVRTNRRTILGVLAAALLGVPLLAGCGSGGGGGGGSTGTVPGIVVDSLDADAPVGGATVTIGGKTGTTAASGNVGTFTLTGVTVGADTAVVTASGQAPQTIGLDSPVVAGTNASVTLVLNIGQIRGTVTLNGQPVEGATVVETSGAVAVTDTQGKFQLDDILPTPDGGEPTTVFATYGTASASTTLTVVNGLNNVGTLALVDTGGGAPPGLPQPTIQGVVLRGGDSAGPAVGATVFLFRNGVQFGSPVTADANGHYGFYAPQGGGYTVSANLSSYQTATSAAVAVGDPNSPTMVPDLTLQPNP